MEKHIVDITDDALADMDTLYEHIANKLPTHLAKTGEKHRNKRKERGSNGHV